MGIFTICILGLLLGWSWAGHVAHMVEVRIVCKVSVKTPEGRERIVWKI